MPSLTSEAMNLHAPRLIEASGIRVRYKRGRMAAVVDAVPGSMLFGDQQTEGEAQISTRGENILIPPGDLILGGDKIEPFPGDQIEHLDEETGAVLEVWDVRPGSQGQAWDYSDGWRTFFRIFVIRRSGELNVTSF
jgi:hypothetical protein